MFSSRHSNGTQAAFGGVATILSLVGTIYVAPMAWPVIEGKIWNSLIGLYSHDWTVLLYWGAKLGFYPLSFFALRAAIASGFVMLAAAAAKRFI